MNMLNKILQFSTITMALKQIIRTPFASFFIILIMTLALFLVTTFYTLWQSIETLAEKWNKSAEISLYLKKKTSLKEASVLAKNLEANPNVAKVDLIQPTEGIKTFMENATLKTLLANFKENPLPTVITITPKVKALEKNEVLKFIQELNSLPKVENVKADAAWIEQGHNWLNLWGGLAMVFMFLLNFNMLLVLSGTSYIIAKTFTLKNKAPKIILQYQFAWFGLISSLFAILGTRIISMLIQDHGIKLAGLAISWSIFIILISGTLSFYSAKIGTNSV